MSKTMQALRTPNVMTNEHQSTGLCGLSAGELAKQIRDGRVSALEAVEAHIARIEKANPKLNAAVVKRYDAARAEARAVDARRAKGETLPPLAGVPVTIKECLDLEGTASTFGLETRKDLMAKTDDPYVARLRAAGAIPVAKTNVAQLLFYVESDNPVYGRTNNPWNVERTPGGSSGGEAALIAVGASPLGLGTDIGGSLRAPAHYCGIASIRPTAGRTPDQGRFSMPIGARAVVSQVGPMAREVSDLALALSIIDGGESGRPLGDYRAVDVSKLRIALVEEDGAFAPCPASRRAVREAGEALKAAGAKVTPWQLPEGQTALVLFLSLMSADGGAGMKRMLKGSKRDFRLKQLLMLLGAPRWWNAFLGRVLGALGQNGLAGGLACFGFKNTDRYWSLVEQQMDYVARLSQALDEGKGGPFDLVLMPAFPVPAVRHGATANMPMPGAYSVLANITGFPAGVVPFTRVRAGEESDRPKSGDIVQKTARAAEEGSAGLPVGVQVVARPWQENIALAAMEAIQRAAKARPDYPRLAPL